MTGFMIHAAGWLAVALASQTTCADEVILGDQPWQRSEWRASTFSTSAQDQATIAVVPRADDGGDEEIVSVWVSRRQNHGHSGVFAQRFTIDGVAIGTEMAVSLWTGGHAATPAIATGRDAAGRSVTWIAWQAHGQDGQEGAIVARLFDADFDGGSEILVNQHWQGHQQTPVVAALAGGGAVIAWMSAPDANGITTIHARLIGAEGSPIGDEFQIGGCIADRWERSPCVAADSTGGFAVGYAVGDDEGGSGICLARFDRHGQRVGDEVEVAADLAHLHSWPIEPALAVMSHGYIVAWHDLAPGGGDYRILARSISHHDSSPGPVFEVSPSAAGSQIASAITVLPDDRFFIAWNSSDREDEGLMAQLFAADATPMREPIRLNAHTPGRQAMRLAAGTQRLAVAGADSQPRLLCAWNGDAGFGDDSSVNITMLSTTAPVLDGRAQGVIADIAAVVVALASPDGPAPYQPPTFDPRAIEQGERDILEGVNPAFTAIINTGWTPPDPHLAVGPDHIVVMTNGAIAFFDKAGTLLFQDEIEGGGGFWGSVGAGPTIFDPEVLWDPFANRFIAMASDQAFGAQSFVCFAVSDDANPVGTWHKYRLNTTALSAATFDSPNIAVDESVLYITGDRSGPINAYPVYTLDKAPLLIGAPAAFATSQLMPTSTESAGIPPVSFDDPPALYLIEHKEAANNTTVRLVGIQDPLGTPTFTDFILTVPSYGPPEDPPQMGTFIRPETFDARFWSCAYRNGSLWATHHINSARVLVRWYEIAMNGWPLSGKNPELVQSGTIDPGPTVRTFFSAITADVHGNAMISMARSSPTEFISFVTAFRFASDPLGTFQPVVTQHTSTGPYTFANRWGDYSAVNVDPSDGLTFWAHHEYNQNNGWRTWVTSFTPPFPAGDLTFNGAVDGEDLGILLKAWGACPEGATCPADLTGEGQIDGADLGILLLNWTG